ncbi:hypothetical protein PQE20_17855 [Vibrio harveyi]|uniref:hypothetical protein n=1 Tax=Vibrio TaxID=662 RepID=UPI000BE270C8|nr:MULTISPECIES: hypothetical protein [Vibrio harveyi group]ATI44278.1 hypothetical protein CO725_01070 [Vibrio parahaemolyticus]WCP83284.1 hypothetical protein PQE20_17855 [Vibrio harveyi]
MRQDIQVKSKTSMSVWLNNLVNLCNAVNTDITEQFVYDAISDMAELIYNNKSLLSDNEQKVLLEIIDEHGLDVTE